MQQYPAPPLQLRLDTEVIKGLLCDLARAGGALDSASVAAFAAEVHAQLGRAEAVLKVGRAAAALRPRMVQNAQSARLPAGHVSRWRPHHDVLVFARVQVAVAGVVGCYGTTPKSNLCPTSASTGGGRAARGPGRHLL